MLSFLAKISSILLLLFTLPLTGFTQNSLSGTITDAKDGTPLIGATVSIPEIKSGAVTDADGSYSIQNIPTGNFLIQVRYLGYATITQRIAISGSISRDFKLSTSVIEQGEVIVTGVSTATEARHTPTPISVVSRQELEQSASSNIIDALAKQPGISQVTTGPGISKPEIRGLGYNRVVVMNDGIRQEGQQWGDEHGIEIDQYSANKVEILKGPGTIMYGSDAIAGVINILSPDPVVDGKIIGDILGNYQSNNGLIGYSAVLSGNDDGLVWSGRFSGKMAHSYQNANDGYVFNSGFREMAGSGYFGFNKKWGYSHLNFSVYHFKPGLSEGERDSSGNFTRQIVSNDTSIEEVKATDSDFLSYEPSIPFQNINHYKVSLMNNIYIGSSKLYFNLGYENNQRKEFDDVLDPKAYGLYFFLNTVPYDVRWTLPETEGWIMTFGVNGMFQNNRNHGTEFLIPEYDLFDAGGFLYAQKNLNRLSISGGIRYDNRSITTQTLFLNSDNEPVFAPDSTASVKFTGAKSDFSAITGSVGVSYEVSERILIKGNIARGFRAPNIAELGANGRHEGTFRYEIGNPDLHAETSWQFDGGIGFRTDHFEGELDLFNNTISDFIFPEKLLSQSGGDSLIADKSDLIPVYQYVQGHANLSGGEVSVDIHPHPFDWLHFKNSFSIVSSVQNDHPDSTKYLPFTPAPRFQSELRGNFKKLNSTFRNCYASVEATFVLDQNHVYSAYNTETPTPGYTLVSVTAGTDVFINERRIFSVYLNGENLGDAAYQDHLSRLKYAPENPSTGRMGIYNIGRNFSIKVNIPLDIKG